MKTRVYRCFNCRKAITEYKVLVGDSCVCGSRRLSPTNPRWFELPLLIMEVLWYRLKRRS